jgi:ankyrin repeat protein
MGLVKNLKLKLATKDKLFDIILKDPNILAYCFNEELYDTAKKIMEIAHDRALELTLTDSLLIKTLKRQDEDMCLEILKNGFGLLNETTEEIFQIACDNYCYKAAKYIAEDFKQTISKVYSNDNSSLLVLLKSTVSNNKRLKQNDYHSIDYLKYKAYNHCDVIILAKYLIDNGCNLSQVNDMGETALTYLCNKNYIYSNTAATIATYITKQTTCFPNYVYSGNTPLMMCCMKPPICNKFNFNTTVTNLLKLTDGISYVNDDGNDALIYACVSNNTQAAVSLFKTGLFDPQRTNKKNRNAMYYAVHNSMYYFLDVIGR